MIESVKDLTVLVVEDSRGALSQMKGMLAYLEVGRVFTARDGEEALDFLGDCEEPLDLVLCDWHIPGPTGLDVLRHVRTVAPGLPFIMVTGAADLDSIIEARRSGATAYIVKPYSQDELGRKLAFVVGIRRDQEEVA
jgi:two-component system chemotaxis response regulator CheY